MTAQIQAQKAFELAKVKCENEQSYRGIARTEIAFLTKNYSAEYTPIRVARRIF